MALLLGNDTKFEDADAPVPGGSLCRYKLLVLRVFCSYNMVSFDESKRLENIARHQLDFIGCDGVFDNPVVTAEDDRDVYGEQRSNLLGWLWGRVVHMTYTERNDDVHVISLRKATTHEARNYFKIVSCDPGSN
jgi:uncharacterized protein